MENGSGHAQHEPVARPVDGAFTAEELANSFPFDPCRLLTGPAAKRLLDHCVAEIASSEGRRRRRSQRAEISHRRTVEAILANLIAGTLNRVDGTRFAAVSKNRNDYVGSVLSYPSLREMLHHMVSRGWIELQRGFYGRDSDYYADRGRLTRIRATQGFRDLIEACGITRRSVASDARGLIRLKTPTVDKAIVPAEVEHSRTLLAALNARLADAHLHIPEAVWTALSLKPLPDEGDEDADARQRRRKYAGDLSAASLYRVFNNDWLHGGRLYGGWWMGVGKDDRSTITIDGQQTAELDYAQLHPTILYAREQQDLSFDPYTLPGFDSDDMRALGKRTFNRLINSTSEKPLRAASGDLRLLPRGMKFAEYRDRLIARHSPIACWFRTGEGLRLQREDSELALCVLKILHHQGIVALPVHDSFIVPKDKSDKLRHAMVRAFRDKYGYNPTIR